jgi:hypothetical protein
VLIVEASLHRSAVLTNIDASVCDNNNVSRFISSSVNLGTSDGFLKCTIFGSPDFESELFEKMIGTQYVRRTAINIEQPPITTGFNWDNSFITISQIDLLLSI